MSIKIGLITFHSSVNYGAMLQAYSLQKYLIICGYECIIIDYVTRKHELEYLPDDSIPKPGRNAVRYAKFMHFMKTRMCLTERKYYTVESLREDFPQFDIYMSGSDQVWNLDFVGDVTPIYFLSLPQFKNRIAYGSSIGKCNPKKIYSYKKYLKNYKYIFPREKTTALYLSKILNRKIEPVVDPTLLLNRTEWKKLVKKSMNHHPYLLFYIAEDDDYSFRKAQKIAKAIGNIDIITISYEKVYRGYHVYNCTTAGPIEFLNLIYNAAFVFTTSFHGSIFSIIYNIPFYVMLQHENDTRITDLFDSFSLRQRLFGKDDKMSLTKEILLKRPGISDKQLERISNDSKAKIHMALKDVLEK